MKKHHTSWGTHLVARKRAIAALITLTSIVTNAETVQTKQVVLITPASITSGAVKPVITTKSTLTSKQAVAPKQVIKQQQPQVPKIVKLYYEDKKTLKYEGTIKNGMPHGIGKSYDFNGGLMYEGEFANGDAEGKGKMYDDKGILSYVGEMKGGFPTGKGTWYDDSGKETGEDSPAAE